MEHTVSFDTMPQCMAELLTKMDLLAADVESVKSAITNISGLSQTMTLPQVADMLGKSTSTIYGMTAKGEIPHYRPGNTLVFMPDEIIEWIKSFPSGSKPKRRKKPKLESESSFPCLPPDTDSTDVASESSVDYAASVSEESAKGGVSEPQIECSVLPYQITERTHTKTGETLYAVTFSDGKDNKTNPQYTALAQQYHGYWTRYDGGFYSFKNRDDAERFANECGNPSA